MTRRLLLVAFVLLSARPILAQTEGRSKPIVVTTPEPMAGVRAVARADELIVEGRPLAALTRLEGYLRSVPSDYEARWRAARACVVLGVMAPDEDDRDRWLERGIEHGERALEARPDGDDGLYWTVASKGWRAMTMGNPFHAAGLAEDVFHGARELLERRPDHAGAHHALGKLHHEIMTLSAFERFLGRHIFGVDALGFASWRTSLEHLQRATELEPEMVLYRLDLGMSYHRSGRPEEAREALREALALPSTYPPDPLFKQRAEALLAEVEEELADRPPPGAPRRPVPPPRARRE